MHTTITTASPRLPRLHRSTRWLLVVIAVGLSATVTTRVLSRLDILPTEGVPTSLLVFVLVIGAMMLVGNIVVTEAWVFMAERNGDRGVMRFAGQALNWADVCFTTPGICLAVVSGLFLTTQMHEEAGWLLGAEVCFISAGVVWAVLLVPMQNRLAVRAEHDRIDDGFFRILHRWYWIGILATLLTLVALAFVVFRPE